MSSSPNRIRQILSLTNFEVVKLFRQKRAFAGMLVIFMLNALCTIAIYLRQQRHPNKKLAGHLVTEFFNGIAYAETVLLPSMYILFPMVIGILTAGMFAGEFQAGLIRTVAIRPVRRGSLFLSKFLCMAIYSYILLAALFVISYPCGASAFGVGGDIIVFGPAFMGHGAKVFIMPENVAWQRLFLSYFFAGYALISIASMFMMFSAIFKKMTMAIVVPLGIYYTSYILDMLPFMEDLQRFLPTRYLMIWKYTMASEIQWDSIIQDGIFLTAYTVCYLVVGALVFRSSDL